MGVGRAQACTRVRVGGGGAGDRCQHLWVVAVVPGHQGHQRLRTNRCLEQARSHLQIAPEGLHQGLRRRRACQGARRARCIHRRPRLRRLPAGSRRRGLGRRRRPPRAGQCVRRPRRRRSGRQAGGVRLRQGAPGRAQPPALAGGWSGRQLRVKKVAMRGSLEYSPSATTTQHPHAGMTGALSHIRQARRSPWESGSLNLDLHTSILTCPTVCRYWSTTWYHPSSSPRSARADRSSAAQPTSASSPLGAAGGADHSGGGAPAPAGGSARSQSWRGWAGGPAVRAAWVWG